MKEYNRQKTRQAMGLSPIRKIKANSFSSVVSLSAGSCKPIHGFTSPMPVPAAKETEDLSDETSELHDLGEKRGL